MSFSSAGQNDARAFVQNSLLDVFVPDVPNSRLSTLLGSISAHDQESGASVVPVSLTRDLVFLDERVTVCILLKSPFLDEPAFKSLLSRIVVSLETHAVGTSRQLQADREQGSSPPSHKDLVDARTFEGIEDPFVAIGTGTENYGPSSVYVLWKTEVHFNRTRIGSINPSAYFTASITLKPDEVTTQDVPREEIMDNGVTETINLLQSFQSDPDFRNKVPKMSASRLSKILPSNVANDDVAKPLKNNTRRLIRLVPALSTKLRVSRVGVSPSQAKVLASLDVEISPSVHDIVIEDMNITLSGGKVETLTATSVVSLPRSCNPQDIVSFVYKLIPEIQYLPSANDSTTHTLNVRLSAYVPRDDMQIPLSTQWRTNVDLSSLLKHPVTDFNPFTPSLTNSSTNQSRSKNPTGSLVTLTISGPSTVAVRSTLRWKILLANRSSSRTLRLALIPITSESLPPFTNTSSTSKSDAQRHRHKATLSSTLFSRTPGLEANTSSTDTSLHHGPGLIPMTADVRIGPLQPGACATAEMRFLVLRAGILGIEAIRVVDLDEIDSAAGHGHEEGSLGSDRKGKDWTDIDKAMLPDVVATELHDL